MKKLRELLKKRVVKNAVVIDDVFDDIPRPDELTEGDWSNFFDDLGASGNALLSNLFPGYERTSMGDLIGSQEFISILWEYRDKLPTEAREHLFRDYESTQEAERKILEALIVALEGFGLTCSTMGKEFDERAREADLIFIDLFLGFHQSEQDMDRAVSRVSQLVTNRAHKPPLVVLMSRSTRLWEKRNDFRDKAGLLGSTFRIASKADLTKDGRLETLLTRLANHYEDAKRVAAFVQSWNDGLEQARDNFVRILRRLDLSDLAQIRTLLLDFEGQKLGEYLLDVSDRVLQHEIEAQVGTISAAQELNKIELGQYPAPHLAGSSDLQDLVHRMIFQHVRRLELSVGQDVPTIQYGDVLRRKNTETGKLTSEVFLVATPACDLARAETENVFVLPGTLMPLVAKDWSYGATVTKTPIFKSQDGSRHWIRWHLKKRQTIPLATLCEGLQHSSSYVRVGRIREIFATELQQKLLADMGRIGQPAKPPATFPVSIALYVVSPDATTRSVPVESMETASCFVGRDAQGRRVDHLVLGEDVCDALRETMQSYPLEDVRTSAKESLSAMKTDLDFFERFERGLMELPRQNGKWNAEKGKDNRTYLYLVRNEGVEEGISAKSNYRKAPFVMKITDILSAEGE